MMDEDIEKNEIPRIENYLNNAQTNEAIVRARVVKAMEGYKEGKPFVFDYRSLQDKAYIQAFFKEINEVSPKHIVRGDGYYIPNEHGGRFSASFYSKAQLVEDKKRNRIITLACLSFLLALFIVYMSVRPTVTTTTTTEATQDFSS